MGQPRPSSLQWMSHHYRQHYIIYDSLIDVNVAEGSSPDAARGQYSHQPQLLVLLARRDGDAMRSLRGELTLAGTEQIKQYRQRAGYFVLLPTWG